MTLSAAPSAADLIAVRRSMSFIRDEDEATETSRLSHFLYVPQCHFGLLVGTIVYGLGDFLFESDDINHTVFSKTDAHCARAALRNTAGQDGRSLILLKHH